MHSLVKGTTAGSEQVFASICVGITVFMLLSEGVLEVRGWAATKPAWANVACKVNGSGTTGSFADDWQHARVCLGIFSQFLCVIVGFCAYTLTMEGAAPSKSTFPQVLQVSCAASANKSLPHSFHVLLGDYALTIATKFIRKH